MSSDQPKRGPGRPPKAAGERRGKQVPVRLTDAEHEEYTGALGSEMGEIARRAWKSETRRRKRQGAAGGE